MTEILDRAKFELSNLETAILASPRMNRATILALISVVEVIIEQLQTEQCPVCKEKTENNDD